MTDLGGAALERIERLEAQFAIQQLAITYSIALDSRDLDLMVEQWSPEVWMGKALGQGREAVRTFFVPIMRNFYRSMHMIAGHRIVLVDADNATGTVYCRAEHESLDDWVVQAIAYEDTYRRVDGQWGFLKRLHRHWYSWPIGSSPAGPTFELWPDRDAPSPVHGQPAPLPDLPHAWPSWDRFWDEAGPEAAKRFSRFPDRPA
jgi:hypothetical protein